MFLRRQQRNLTPTSRYFGGGFVLGLFPFQIKLRPYHNFVDVNNKVSAYRLGSLDGVGLGSWFGLGPAFSSRYLPMVAQEIADLNV
jgi:hypothetical protein